MKKKIYSALKVCVYCGGNHISTRCNTITHIETRRNILKKAGRCILCLSKGHLKKYCKVKYNCVKCDSKDHNVSICDKINEKNHDVKETRRKFPHFANSLKSTIDSPPDCFCKSFEYRRKTFRELSRDF